MKQHLAFVGAEYAMCGATVKDGNNTVSLTVADCPDCVLFMKNEEKINKNMHGAGLKPDYEE